MRHIHRKTKVLIAGLLIIFILMSYYVSTLQFEAPQKIIDEKLKEIEEKAEDYHRLLTSAFTYSGLSITEDMNLNEGYPYTFSGNFWNDANLEEAFTAGWLETKRVGDDYTYNDTVSVPNNYNDEFPEVPDNIEMNDGIIGKDGDLASQDGDEAWFNSSEGYHYPATFSFEDELGETGTDISFINYSSTPANTEIIEIISSHRNILKQTNVGGSSHSYNDFDIDRVSGIVEFWVYAITPTKETDLYLQGAGGVIIELYIISGNFYYKDSSGVAQTIQSCTASTWYHIRISWFESSKFDLFINGIKKVNYQPTRNPIGTGINRFYFRVFDTTSYIDAIGYNWDSNYVIGANYYWQYYRGSEIFGNYNHSVNSGLYHGSPYCFNDEVLGELSPDFVSVSDNCITEITDYISNHYKTLRLAGGGEYYDLYSVPSTASFSMLNGTKTADGDLWSLDGNDYDFTGAGAGSASGSFNLIPNGDGATVNWQTYPASPTTHYTKIDEYPATDTGDFNRVLDGDELKIEQYNMNTTTFPGTVNTIKLYIYLLRQSGCSDDLKANLYDGSSWLGEKTYVTTTSINWFYVEWTGLTLTQTQVNNLLVQFKAPSAIAAGHECSIYTLYTQCTYSYIGSYILNFTSIFQYNTSKIDPTDTFHELKINYGQKVNATLTSFVFQIWNFTSSTWYTINSSITTTAYNCLFTLTSHFYNATGHIKLKWVGILNAYNFKLYLDLLLSISTYSIGDEYSYGGYIKHNFITVSNNDIIEFWMYILNTNRVITFGIGNSSDYIIYICNNETSTFKYSNGTGWTTIFTYSIQTWYHFKIQWYSTTNTFDLYVNEVKYVNGGKTYRIIGSSSNIQYFKYYLYNTTVYLDAFGVVSDSGYLEGQNKNPYEEELLNSWFLNNWAQEYALGTYVYITGSFDKHPSYLNISDYSSINRAGTYYIFPDTISGIIELWFRSPPTGKNATINIEYSTGEYGAFIRFDIDNTIDVFDGGWVNVMSISQNTWYRIRIDFNCLTDTYDLYVNDILKRAGNNFFFGRTYLNKLLIRTSDSLSGYSICVDSVRFSWLDSDFTINDLSVVLTLNFTIKLQFADFVADTLELKIWRYQYIAYSTGITLFIFNWTSSLWVNVSYTTNTVGATYTYTNTATFEDFINDTFGIWFMYYAINRDGEYFLRLDRFQVRIYKKSLFSIEKTFYQRCVWKYRFHLTITSLGNVYTDWVYFDVVQNEPNVELVSESLLTTRWDFLTTGYTEIEIFDEEFSDATNYWDLYNVPVRYFCGVNEEFDEDAHVYSGSPNSNYGSGVTVNVNYDNLWGYFAYYPSYYDLNLTDLSSLPDTTFNIVVGHMEYSGMTQNIYNTSYFSESTITWNNKPSLGTLLYTQTFHVWDWSSVILLTGTSDRYNYYVLRNTVSGTTTNYVSTEGDVYYGKHAPYIYQWFWKNYQGNGILYMQTNTTETLSLRSPIDEMSLEDNYLIEVWFNTTTSNKLEFNLLNDGLEVESYVLSAQGNTNYGTRSVVFSVDSDIDIDQFEVSGILNDKENVIIESVKVFYYNSSAEIESYYVDPDGSKQIYVINDNYEVQVYEQARLRQIFYITTTYMIQTLILTRTLMIDCYINFYDINNEYLNFFIFKVYINYTYDEIIYTDVRMTENHITVDWDTDLSFIIYDSFDVFITTYSITAQPFIDITLNIYSLKIKNNAYEMVDYELQRDLGITKYGLLAPEELLAFSIASGNYTLTYTNYEDMGIRIMTFELSDNRIININTTYREIYFALFTYDGFGIDPSTIRFYINSSRKDLGFNMIISRFVNLTVMDFFEYILFQQVIDTDVYTMAFNIYIEIYTLTILNLFNFEDIKVNISRGIYWMEQVIPMTTGLNYRFLPNVNYTINAKYLNDTILETRYINLTTNGHIESFGETLPYPEDPFFPRDMWINLYNPYGFSITNNLKIYINGSRIEGGSTQISTNSTNVVVMDYFERILYNNTITYSRELNILINTTTVIIHNECKKAIIVRIKMLGDSDWRISQTLGQQDGLIFEFLNGNYTIQGEYMTGVVIDTKNIEIGTDEKIISFGFYDEIEIPAQADLIDSRLADYILAFILLGVIIIALAGSVYYYYNRSERQKRKVEIMNEYPNNQFNPQQKSGIRKKLRI